MKRLEYTRKTRASMGHTKNATEAVLALAHASRERQRLQQERVALEKRIRRIEVRLTEIAGTETKLVPVIQSGLHQMAPVPAATHRTLAIPPAALPPNAGEVTLRY